MPFNNPLVSVPKAPITIGIIVTFMFHSIFQFSSKVEVLILLFTFFQFYPLVSRDTKVDNFADFFLFFFFFCWLLLGLVFCPRFGDLFVYQKSHRSLCVIFWDRYWVVHIPYVGMINFRFLAHFPVDHLAHPVVSRLIVLLCQFAAFAYSF